MIRKLSGTIIETNLTNVIVDINGIGYLVHTISAGINYKIDQKVSFWTYLAVRETALDLYGFGNRDELEVFELLISLPKIGPKSAIQILSQADIILLKQAIAQEDPTYLSKMSGIGKKSAEKIVMGLKDKFDDIGFYKNDGSNNSTSTSQSEAIDALITLGYPQKDAREMVLLLSPEITTTNEILKEALKKLGS